VDVRRLDDPVAFLEAAEPLLLGDEARHNLILGLAATFRDHPSLYPEYRLWLMQDGSETIGAALRTPPQNLILARPRDAGALEALAGALDEEIPGVVGALPEVETFADIWSGRVGATPHRRMTQGIYSLERVQPVSDIAGRMRPATEDDRPLLLDWWRAFAVEALPDDDQDEERLHRGVEHRLVSEDAGIVLWEHDCPVSLAAFGNRTPNGIRIGPVYTPPEKRGHGYASALVAALSASLLASGRRFCFLYTNLANPTSNAIYERIGYDLVGESAEVVFELS
jgi:predicted GNAT family acetyltransferase